MTQQVIYNTVIEYAEDPLGLGKLRRTINAAANLTFKPADLFASALNAKTLARFP